MQVNVPRCLPFSEVGKVKQAACGGTGCAVLNGESHFSAAPGETMGDELGKGPVCVLQIPEEGARLWEHLVAVIQ